MKNFYLKSCFVFFALMFCLTSICKAQYDVVVAKDGTGNYTTIQAAINAAPTGLAAPYKIFIKKGKYREQLTIPSNKPFLEFIGEDVATTVISYGDGGGGTTTVTINANDCMMMNLTMENTQGYLSDGPQSLAVKTNNVDRIVFKDCRFISGQDTVYVNGSGKRVYFKNCYIDGNTDFIYGAAIAVFDTCVIYPRDRVDGSNGGIITAANTPNGQAYGLVFRDCIIPTNRGITSYSMGRPWQNDAGTPSPAYNKTVFLNTTMSNSIQPTGWSVWDAGTNTSTITYAEFRSRKFDSSLVNTSQRLSWTQQLTASQATPYYVNSNMFGSWNPYAVWPDLAGTTLKPIALANFRGNRTSTLSTLSLNISWPISNVKYELYRSTDSIAFSKINETTIASDTIAAVAFTDALPPSGTSYFYKIIGSKAGYTSFTTDTIIKINISIPLNGDYRSVGSGGFTNNVSAITTIASGALTSVTVTSSPIGYTSAPTVTFTTAPAGGTTATGTAILTGGTVTGVTILNPGSGYTSAPSATFSTAGVGGNSIWQKYNSATSNWDAVPLGTSPSNANVTIVSGHTVALNALVGITALNIENGAVFQTDGQARNFRIKGDVFNNGVFGGTNPAVNKVTLEMDGTNGTYNISGSGVYNFATIRALTGVQTLVANISANITLSGNLQAWYASGTATDQGTNNVTINIANGVTVVANALHNTNATNTSVTYGTYTYNVNGILDLSASTTLTGLIPNATASTKVLTMNVNGILRTGTQFRTVSTAPGASESKVVLNIGATGLVDATKANTLFAVTPNYFIVAGDGALERRVTNTDVVFPIGTSSSSYNPVTLNNSGTADNFTVGVKNSFTVAFPSPNNALVKQWSIVPDNTAGSNVVAKFGWIAPTDQGSSFVPMAGLGVFKNDGTVWTETASSAATGSGTLAAPYTTTASGFTSFGNFTVANSGSLPLTLLSFDAGYDHTDHIKIVWKTTKETKLSSFVIERSKDGINFYTIGTVAAKNNGIANGYELIDPTAYGDKQYYRLKSISVDGSYNVSNIVLVTKATRNNISVYPNPTTSLVYITHGIANTGAKAEIFSADGKLVLTQKLQQNLTQSSLDVSKMAPGSYLLRVTNGNDVSTNEIIKL